MGGAALTLAEAFKLGAAIFGDLMEDEKEDVSATLRQGRAQAALTEIRRSAADRGLDRLPQRRIREIVEKSRKARQPKAAGGGRGVRGARLSGRRPV